MSHSSSVHTEGSIFAEMATATSDSPPVQLLWTGGWDSTFRLLQLLLVLKREVQPFYLIHTNRPSTLAELRAMEEIRCILISRYPDTASRLHSLRLFFVSDVAPNDDISQSYQQILAIRPLGIQYDWLARFCLMNDIQGMELSIHKGDTARDPMEAMIVAHQLANETSFCMDVARINTPEYRLFSSFRFPLFHTTKDEMKEIAEREGFLDIMYKTWFCHHPKSGLQPCGVCNPCCAVMRSGMKERIPLSGRIRHHLNVIGKLRRWVRGNSERHLWAKKLLGRR